jgi:hypothetical protein
LSLRGWEKDDPVRETEKEWRKKKEAGAGDADSHVSIVFEESESLRNVTNSLDIDGCQCP